MQNTNSFRKYVLWWISVALISLSCDPWFSYSPYEATIDELQQATTAKNLALIDALDTEGSDTFKVAVFSDPHYHYRKLEDAIAYINSRSDYSFAIVAGDLSENGLKQEFVFFYRAMSRLNIPYLTTIGNHDYLSNGEKIYAQMFGPRNYEVIFNNVKFVFFDNTTVESNQAPDMSWLASVLSDNENFDHVIPVSHIPPYDQQMDRYRDEFHHMLVSNKITLSLHGHRHEFSVYEPGNDIRYVTVSSPQYRSYSELIISAGGLSVEKVEY